MGIALVRDRTERMERIEDGWVVFELEFKLPLSYFPGAQPGDFVDFQKYVKVNEDGFEVNGEGNIVLCVGRGSKLRASYEDEDMQKRC